MPHDDFLSMVFRALPGDMRSDDLKCLGKPEWWENNPSMAVAYALRHCKRINWTAYLEIYPDVKDAGADPVLHFIRDGVFEGRKLFSWPPMQKNAKSEGVKVSTIIHSSDSAIYLEKCLANLVSQTLKDIEIIVVDDGSRDGSLEIAYRFAKVDSRVRVIELGERQGRHMARRTGATMAIGQYVMFLDADDFYHPDACEKAWLAVSKGYDMGSFGRISINYGLPLSGVHAEPDMANLPARPFTHNEVMRFGIEHGRLPPNIKTKIFASSLASSAFGMLHPGNYSFGENVYEFLAMVSQARNMIQIGDRLYDHMSPPKTDASLPKFDQCGNAVAAIEEFCEIHNLRPYFHCLKKYLCRQHASWLGDVPDNQVTSFINSIVDSYGILFSITTFVDIFFDDLKTITTKFRHYQYSPSYHGKRKKRIGLIHYQLEGGGIETTMQNICRLLEPLGYEIVLFLNKRIDEKISLSKNIKIYYLHYYLYRKGDLAAHLSDLFYALQDAKIDVLLHWLFSSPFLPWYSIVCHLLGIGIISSLREEHNTELIRRGRPYDHDLVLRTLHILDKCTCLNTSTEIYLRACGIDCQYLPNTYRKFTKPIEISRKKNNICVLSRLDDPRKCIVDSLAVLKEIIKECYDARIIFIGDFENQKYTNIFYERVSELKLHDKITVTGWIHDPSPLLDESKVLLSTSFLEGFPNSLTEAQGRGLPVVMYYLDIMLAKDNESIIQVPQKDVRSAAREIVRLLKDESLRQKLAKIAMEKAARFSEARFRDDMVNLVENYDKQSSVSFYSMQDYQCALKSMVFYAGKSMPNY